MQPLLILFLSLVFGFLAGIFLGQRLRSQREQGHLQALEEERKRLWIDLTQAQASILQAEKKVSSLSTERDSFQKLMDEQKRNLGREFENLANKIFDQKSAIFREHSEKNLTLILNPLRDRIQEFQKKVEDTYHHESRERFALKEEISRIVETSQKMTLETGHLTRALRGDVKAQGNWGELVLERVLAASGLREGHEYILQGTDLGLKNEAGKVQRPDVIVNLPEAKHLIIDSKVSLLHYERAISIDDELGKNEAIKFFLDSIRAHIEGLAAKRYQDLEGLGAPDFVMMFVPSEGAFSFALQNDDELFTKAWEKSIVVVSPTTLLATLRTVASIWKQERQTKNAIEIARQGGALYDKFVLFLESLEDVGVRLQGAQDSYDMALGQLKTGKGNLISRVDRLRELGAKASKQMPASFQSDPAEGGPPVIEETDH